MYGTVAQMRVKPGMEQQLLQVGRDFQAEGVPGFVGEYVYRMDADPSVFYLVVVFANKEAYWANARSPEQDARYKKMRELLQSDPEWHDGEIVDEYHAG
jgi:quinol monooxygenase YgiN